MGKPYFSSPSGGPCWTRDRGYHTPDPWPQHIWDAVNRQPTKEKQVVTTTVKVLIEGNKACEVKIEGAGMEPRIVKPGQFTTVLISGEQRVSVVEVGEFLS